MSLVETDLNLSLHGNTKQGYKVHHKNRPEHRHVEQLKEGAKEADHGGFRG